MTARNKVELRIAGKDYIIVGTEPEEYIQRVGHYIDRKMGEVLKSSINLSTSMAAVLTAINIGDDFLKTHENEANLRKELKKTQDELDALKLEKQRLAQENADMAAVNTRLKLELAKREAELGEVRNSLEKVSRVKE